MTLELLRMGSNYQQILFYGVEYSNECFCGNEFPSDDLLISMSECDMDCAGDSSQKCGGDWAINIRETTQQG